MRSRKQKRKTGVEVALITVKLAAVEYESLILDSLEKNSHGYDGTDEEYRELMTAGNSVDKEVQFYKNEVESGIRLIREYFALEVRYCHPDDGEWRYRRKRRSTNS